MARRPDLPAEITEQIEELDPKLMALKEAGELDKYFAGMEELWALIPEPKYSWDFYPQVLSRITTQEAIEAGRLDDAAKWLQRTRQAYDSDSEAADIMVDFIEAKLEHAAGNDDRAFALFNSCYQRSGKAPFQEEEQYLSWYLEQAGQRGVEVPGRRPRVKRKAAKPRDPVRQATELYDQAEALAENEVYHEAVPLLKEALALLPEPRTDLPLSTELYCALGDGLYQLGQTTDAEQAMRQGLECPDGQTNALIWLVLGQALFDQGRLDEAAEALAQAYRLDAEVFEDEDPKYLGSLGERGLV